MGAQAMTDENEAAAERRALRGRDYGREGIPVILGAETPGVAPPCEGEAAVAAEFRALAEALGHDADTDAAAVIEMVAAREMRRLG